MGDGQGNTITIRFTETLEWELTFTLDQARAFHNSLYQEAIPENATPEDVRDALDAMDLPNDIANIDESDRNGLLGLTRSVESVELNCQHHYHVGANVPGYSPEDDVVCADGSWDAAQSILDEMLNRVVDSADCGHEKTVAECDSCTLYDDVQRALSELEMFTPDHVGHGFSADVHDGRVLPVRYWIVHVPATDCELTDE